MPRTGMLTRPRINIRTFICQMHQQRAYQCTSHIPQLRNDELSKMEIVGTLVSTCLNLDSSSCATFTQLAALNCNSKLNSVLKSKK